MANQDITQDEAAIYDRQIRLWGLEAQQKIFKARILLAGMRAVTGEVAKNLALAGVNSITLLDHAVVREQDVETFFFLQKQDIGKNIAKSIAPGVQNLNPRVEVVVDESKPEDKEDAFFQQFDIVVMFHADRSTLVRVDHLRRHIGKPFYAADTFGMVGYFFCDLTSHTYIEEKVQMPTQKNGEPTKTRTTKTEEYVSFEESLDKSWSDKTSRKLKKQVSPIHFMIHILFKFQKDEQRSPTSEDVDLMIQRKAEYLEQMSVTDPALLDDERLRELCTLLEIEFSPVAAIVGGVLAQEIIKVLSMKELPVQNWFYYDGSGGTGLIHEIQ